MPCMIFSPSHAVILSAPGSPASAFCSLGWQAKDPCIVLAWSFLLIQERTRDLLPYF